jgi:monofunctional biosynthetic peptidoglycan transglycosylase
MVRRGTAQREKFQAADIALVTQKDSEDDRDGERAEKALAVESAEAEHTPPRAEPAVVARRAIPDQEKVAAEPDFAISASDVPTAETFGDERPGAKDQSPETVVEEAAPETQLDEITPEPPQPPADEPLVATWENAYDQRAAPVVSLPTPPEGAGAPQPDAEDRGLAVPEVPEPQSAEGLPEVARRSWVHPPPLSETPAWVRRDVAPDIADRPEVDEPATAGDEFHQAIDPIDEARPVVDEPVVAPEPETPPPYVASDALESVSAPPASTQEAVGTSSPVENAPAVVPQNAWNRSQQVGRVEPTFESRGMPAWQETRPGDWRGDVPETARPDKWDRAKELARKGLRYAGYGIAGYFAFVFVLILLYRFVNPPASSLMLVQGLTGTDVHQEWVPLSEISPALVRAVIVSEDWGFCEHYGIDIKAIEQAIERSGGGTPRGASTISMQTTKNLFLWNAKSYIRKAVEVPLTLMIEIVWPKWRILEIYLNVAEWGPGIFGAEAAAQYHFNKPAARLGEREAAQLAASLPNPIIREAGDPGPQTARKASVIQSRMRNAGDAAQCVLGGRR